MNGFNFSSQASVASSGNDIDEPGQLPPVLLVDDTPGNLLALEAVLSALEVPIVAVSSGKEALEWIERQTFAVALVDVQMPGMDGFELTQRLRQTKHGREMPILMITAIHRDEMFARRGYASGAADYITKPYDPQVIRARVRAFIDLYRQRDAVRRGQLALRTHERDEAIRRLVALERISTAVLETKDVRSLLIELLGAFIGAADAADSATILLRDGEWLRAAASVGTMPNVFDSVEVKIGQGFAGLVAAERRPLEITDAAVSHIAHPPSIAMSGVRAMYGIPLLHAGQVLGVASIGTTKAGMFTEPEKRLLSAAAERAALAVARQLELSELNEVLESAPAYIAIVSSARFDYCFANAPMRELFKDDLVGGSVKEYGFGNEAHAAIELAGTQARPIEVAEIRVSCSNITSLPAPAYVKFSARPLHNVSGFIDRVLVVAIDISAQVEGRLATERAQTAHARLLEREQAARRAAELASTAKDEFLATVSHELRTPLSAILGWAAIARARPDADKEKALVVIERNARSQARIVDDVLDFSRMSKGKMRLALRNVAVRDLIDAALESVRPAADSKGIGIDLDIEDELVIAGDADRLQQVVWNLLANAVKFSGQGARVAVRVSSADFKTTLSVSDTGQGIDPDFLPYVFEPFRQANGSTTRRHGGLGLGLAIVRQIVQGHGGTIEAHSEGLGQGSTFTVILPHCEVPPVKLPSKSNPELGGDGALVAELRLDGMRVLVVDDDQDSRELLEQALTGRGAEVVIAESAYEGLAHLEHFKPDVLVSDLAMPEADGYELVRRVRALPAERGGTTPALALTAHTGKEALERALSSGFQRYAQKPVDLACFVEIVSELARTQV